MVFLTKSRCQSLAGLILFGLLLLGPDLKHAFGKEESKSKDEPKSVRALKELQKLEAQAQEEDHDPEDKYKTRVETPLIGQYMNFAGYNHIPVMGYGLVVGLKGTGGNPAPSPMRTALLDDLKRRNIRNPNQILQSPDTALVVVRAWLPPLMEKGENIDVEVIIPESAEATSLQGGWLMETYLSEHANVQGRGLIKGHQFVKAKGAVLTAVMPKDREKGSAKLLRGRVLGGGTVLRERDLSIYLKSDFRGYRSTTRISEAISHRFHDFDEHGIQQGMAKPKNDYKIVLRVHPIYKNNLARYLQVIRHLAFRESATAQRIRLQRLKNELLTPETSEKAALQLEGIGKNAIPVLQAGLEAPLLECRFQAACALAYLGESSSVKALAEAVRDERAFRVYALAALSVVDDADAHLALRELMKETSMETRYGSFRTLWVLDKNDPFIRGEELKVLEDKCSYLLHRVDTPGEPLVHVCTRTKSEIVLFGKDQSFVTPLYLSAGPEIIITAQPGAKTASVVKFSPGRPDERREVSLSVSDVIHAVAELDATYPDVVQMLTEASSQNNLPGRFAYDALPEGGRMYERPAQNNTISNKKTTRKTRIGRDNQTPNLFQMELHEKDYSQDQMNEPEEAEPSPEGMLLNVPQEKSNATAAGNPKKTADKSSMETTTQPQRKTTKSTENSPVSRWPSWLKPRIHNQSEPPLDEPDEPVGTAPPSAEQPNENSPRQQKKAEQKESEPKTKPSQKSRNSPQFDAQSEP